MNYGLFSCSNKIAIEFLAKKLISNNYKILCSGGTYECLNKTFDKNIYPVDYLSKFPEILGGKVKTLHPSIFSGILANRDNKKDMEQIYENNLNLIDYVVVNLYPFEKILNDFYENKIEIRDEYDIDKNKLLSNIDIGGQSLIRAAAKNYKYVTTIVDPNDYQYVSENFKNLTLNDRKDLAAKAFDYVTKYDMKISEYFNNDRIYYKKYSKVEELRYGCNPHQDKAFIFSDNTKNLPFRVLNGNPSYINVLDAVTSSKCVTELGDVLNKTVAASFKHTAPAGIGTCKEISTILKNSFDLNKDINIKSDSLNAVLRARNSDPLSSFGDFIAVNNIIDESTALLIKNEVSDGIIAPYFTKGALEILKKKKKGKYVILEQNLSYKDYDDMEFREINGIGLAQSNNNYVIDDSLFNGIKNKDLIDDIKLAYMSLKYIPSNSVCVVHNGQVIGIGCGQQNRLDCIKLATNKANRFLLKKHPKVINLINSFDNKIKRTNRINNIIRYIDGEINYCNEQFKNIELKNDEKDNFLKNTDDLILASDGFLPFVDNIEECKNNNIKHIIQPGGSIMDNTIMDKTKEFGIEMYITNNRLFYH